MRTSLFLAAAATISIGLIASATGGPVTVPLTFTSGTTAKAADVDADFAAIATGVNGNAQDIVGVLLVQQVLPGPKGSQVHRGQLAQQVRPVRKGPPDRRGLRVQQGRQVRKDRREPPE